MSNMLNVAFVSLGSLSRAMRWNLPAAERKQLLRHINKSPTKCTSHSNVSLAQEEMVVFGYARICIICCMGWYVRLSYPNAPHDSHILVVCFSLHVLICFSGCFVRAWAASQSCSYSVHCFFALLPWCHLSQLTANLSVRCAFSPFWTVVNQGRGDVTKFKYTFNKARQSLNRCLLPRPKEAGPKANMP